MESHRFDQVVRRLGQARSRRGLLAGVMTGSAIVANEHVAPAKKRRKNKRKKKRKNKGTTTTLQPTPPATTAAPFCAGKPDLTHCGGHPITGNFCSGGVCAVHPTCMVKDESPCSPGQDPACCGGFCNSSQGRCECSGPGLPCETTYDCCASEVGMQRCVAFICEKL